MTGSSRGQSGTGKAPKGMRLLDGIPVPIHVEVDGETVAVESAKLGSGEGAFHAGRTQLYLTNGGSVQGCIDCPTTHTHWSAILRHREHDHGAPHAARRSKKQRTSGQQGQLELTDSPQQLEFAVDGQQHNHLPDTAADEAPHAVDVAVDVLVPSETDVLPAVPRYVREIQSAAGVSDDALDMTLREILEMAGSVAAAGKALEDMTKDRNKWRNTAREAQRDLRKLNTILGKANSLLKKDEEEG